MDTLSQLLDGVHARGALLTQSILSPPWSLRFTSGAALSTATMLRGRAWITPSSGDPVMIDAGDIAIIRGPAPYTIADEPTSSAHRVMTVADYCAETATRRTDDRSRPRPRTCGVTGHGDAVLLSGAYEGEAGISERLLGELPPVLVVAESDGRNPLLDIISREILRDRSGQQAVLDRLLDLMLIATLRAWFDRPQRHAPSWYRTGDDTTVGRALRLLHERPAESWTVSGLAARLGASRAGLARRFTAEVGEPPMAYLAGMRVALAADLLRDTDLTVAAIARKVGYANAFALSAAFKRRRGMAPTEHRARFAPRTRAG
ncbi:AraC family transcriptional regulator [Nocardia bovistercoris]|uniref:AraC family transcriptional regulator n=1 Tax=Nocardia bovistercoris TaxID=2785916 RepID=A0A931IH90_9NOCA|nr:AraC family transcriptional regulator [Nocardia bovistercoris]